MLYENLFNLGDRSEPEFMLIQGCLPEFFCLKSEGTDFFSCLFVKINLSPEAKQKN